MERKVLLLHLSLNPDYYNLEYLSTLTYDEAVKFCQNDDINCMTWKEEEIDLTQANELTFHADGVANGDGTDTMLNWIKVS